MEWVWAVVEFIVSSEIIEKETDAAANFLRKIEAIATLNRRTIANPEIIAIYKEINDKCKLKTPKFIKTKEELSKFLSSTFQHSSGKSCISSK